MSEKIELIVGKTVKGAISAAAVVDPYCVLLSDPNINGIRLVSEEKGSTMRGKKDVTKHPTLFIGEVLPHDEGLMYPSSDTFPYGFITATGRGYNYEGAIKLVKTRNGQGFYMFKGDEVISPSKLENGFLPKETKLPTYEK